MKIGEIRNTEISRVGNIFYFWGHLLTSFKAISCRFNYDFIKKSQAGLKTTSPPISQKTKRQWQKKTKQKYNVKRKQETKTGSGFRCKARQTNQLWWRLSRQFLAPNLPWHHHHSTLVTHWTSKTMETTSLSNTSWNF